MYKMLALAIGALMMATICTIAIAISEMFGEAAGVAVLGVFAILVFGPAVAMNFGWKP